jgi:predicted ABC-type ATPase
MAAKRMRVFAGPNGSGKTTIFKGILAKEEIQLGVYVNADEIELQLAQSNVLSFDDYQLEISDSDLKHFFRESRFSPVKRKEENLWQKFFVKDNVLKVNTSIDSYLAADIAEFIRQQLLRKGTSFTYETVMSHESKVQFMQTALNHGFRVYLYFIATEDPEINISRVNLRVAQQGHQVLPKKIKNRYYKSLNLLKAAAAHTNREYIFDNSGHQAHLIAEITKGADVRLNNTMVVPNWVASYLLI